MIGVVDIIAAKTAWETAEWGSATPPLKSYAYFPTADDVETGLKYPYVCHQVENSSGEDVSINHIGSVEDTQTHKIWTYLMYGKSSDPIDQLAARDALWRDRLRAGFLLHLANSMTGGGGIMSNVMGDITPVDFDLFGEDAIGLKVSNTIVVRQSMPAGL